MTAVDAPLPAAADQRREALEAFARALRREAHVLAERPELVWQQLHNRLQWEGGAVEERLATERERRSAPDARLWFRTRTPFREADVLLRTLRHEGVLLCALAPNSAWLASAGGGSLRLWDARTGAEPARIDDADDPVVSCAFDCTSSLLVTGSRSGAVQVRSVPTLTPLAELHLEGGAAHCATSPVEPLAALAAGTTLRLVELPSGAERRSASAEDGAFSCCAFSNGGELIATGDDGGTLRLWSTDTLKEQVRAPGSLGIRACAVAPNLAFVAMVPAHQAMVVLVGGPDATGQPQLSALTLFAPVNDCSISPDGRWIACASDDHLAWLYDLDDLTRPVSALEGHTAPVAGCSWAANGSLLATAGRDDTVKLWDPSRGPSRGGIAGHRERVTALAFAPDGSFVASASADMTIKTWDPAPTAERRTFEGHLGPVWDCVALEGGSVVASAAGDGTIRIWDVASGRQTRELKVGSFADVHALACSPDGSLLAVGHDRSLSLFELATGERTQEADVAAAGPGNADRRVQDCAFTPDGERLLVACEDGTLRVWDVVAWHELGVLHGHTGGVWCCATVPGGSFGVSGGSDGTLRLWDLASGAERHVFAGHRDQVWDCAVSADGAVMASVGWAGSLRLWDLASRAPIGELALGVRLRSVALHPSRPRIAIGDQDGWVRVVDVMPDRRPSTEGAESARPSASANRRRYSEGMTDDRLLAATKACLQCGTITELLRFRCPQCSSSMFDVVATGADPELVEEAAARQELSRQHVDQGGRLFQQGMAAEAAKEFRKAIEANPWNATAHGNLGVVLLRTGLPREALQWFERALEIDPNVPGGKDMVEAARRQLG